MQLLNAWGKNYILFSPQNTILISHKVTNGDAFGDFTQKKCHQVRTFDIGHLVETQTYHVLKVQLIVIF